MGKVSMVMFDLSGTTVQDDSGVRDCLYEAAREFGLDTTPEEILYHMGTNKIHLYQFLSAVEPAGEGQAQLRHLRHDGQRRHQQQHPG